MAIRPSLWLSEEKSVGILSGAISSRMINKQNTGYLYLIETAHFSRMLQPAGQYWAS